MSDLGGEGGARRYLVSRSCSWLMRNEGGKAATPPEGIVINSLYQVHDKKSSFDVEWLRPADGAAEAEGPRLRGHYPGQALGSGNSGDICNVLALQRKLHVFVASCCLVGIQISHHPSIHIIWLFLIGTY